MRSCVATYFLKKTQSEWINTDKCECIVDRQDDGVRR
jgi:hypothetical protein